RLKVISFPCSFRTSATPRSTSSIETVGWPLGKNSGSTREVMTRRTGISMSYRPSSGSVTVRRPGSGLSTASLTGRTPFVITLGTCLVPPDLRPLLARLLGYRQVQPPRLRIEIARAGVLDGRDLLEQFVLIGRNLVDHRQVAFAAGGVNPRALGVVEHVVRVGRDRHARDLAAGLAVHHHDHRLLAAAHEPPVLCPPPC